MIDCEAGWRLSSDGTMFANSGPFRRQSSKSFGVIHRDTSFYIKRSLVIGVCDGFLCGLKGRCSCRCYGPCLALYGKAVYQPTDLTAAFAKEK